VTLGPTDGSATEAWFALHGYGQLARGFARGLAPLDDGSRLIVVPEGLSRFYLDGGAGKVGASWMTREGRTDEIADYVRFLDALATQVLPLPPTPTPTPVHVLGFSQGAATACRWVAIGAVRPTRLILWGGEVPPDLDWDTAGSRFRGLDVALVAGDADPYAGAPALAHQEQTLRSHGATPRVIRFSGGHVLDADILRSLAGHAG
jgi:predicted esterase